MGIHLTKLLPPDAEREDQTYLEKMVDLLSQDFDFHSQDSSYASHNFHSFPAKFPPQLPHKLIQELTHSGDAVLDPMMGSGTTLLEAFLLGRYGIGFDIDPLAFLLTKTKVTSLDSRQVFQVVRGIVESAKLAISENRSELEKQLARRWESKTRNFVEYWFAHETQMALLALINEIEQIPEEEIKAFCKLAFSAIIITKSGGLSLAFDLAHTRPHRAKVVFDQAGQAIIGSDLIGKQSRRIKLLTKRLHSPFDEFEKRIQQNLKGLPKKMSDRIQPYLTGLFEPEPDRIPPRISFGDAQALPIDDSSIDLIVTSPPYASNAIDYMRAHKFSLVWLGYAIDGLGEKRKEYIGGESTTDFVFEALPEHTSIIVADITKRDEKKGRVLRRYYSEMTRTLREMFRVLKPGKAAIIVVGSSIMRGKDTETQICLAEIGQTIGFQVPKIGVRNLDRNRRMMPAGTHPDLDSQIQKRMHEEHIIGFYKPCA
ncbi:MAG: site-specific DNA-methyltransferase [Desulfobacteraceae bacterium]|nr:site-specific DNA-methyltransferase [Desulfobacteraceae bacterium]